MKRADPMLRWVTGCAAVLGVLAVGGSAFIPGEGITLGVALGVALAVANLLALQWLGARLVAKGATPGSAAATAMLFGVKILLYLAAVYLVYRFAQVDLMALLGGLSVLVLAIPLGAVIGPAPSPALVETSDE